MNATVKRIVEILFGDAEMTEEVQTLQDEVMANCQERFQDCLDRGLSEDEATAAVIESLKGMEEVIGKYPKKRDVRDAAIRINETDGNTDHTFTFDAETIDRVVVNLESNDVTIETSPDNHIHVDTEADEINVFLAGNELRVSLNKDVNVEHTGSTYTYHGKHVEMDVDLNLANLGHWLRRTFGGVFTQNADVTILLPQRVLQELDISTANGDISVTIPQVKHLTLNTTSGDVDVTIDHSETATLSTTNGDITLSMDADSINMNAVNGDIEYTGRCPAMNIQGVNGDVELNGKMNARIESVNGDVNVHPQGVATVLATLHAVDGDLRNSYPDAGDASDMFVTMSSTSGDLTID